MQLEKDEEYDEEADSDFDVVSGDDVEVSSSEDEVDQNEPQAARPNKRRKIERSHAESISQELDSGDEATIAEQKKAQRKKRRKGENIDGGSEDESDGWRARTRAMREKEKEERKRNKLATSKGSTIDVDKIWEEMNRPEPLPDPSHVDQQQSKSQILNQNIIPAEQSQDKENVPANGAEEMITIKRTYRFAGEVHTEEKVVPKSSAEARLWLSQQAANPQAIASDGKVIQRPLRKISRFDPNNKNLEAFKASWTTSTRGGTGVAGPKLNVVEKSKMDWAVHVDTEGLKEELDEHAKAKEGYLNRMDFLNEVEQRKEAEARAARVKNR